MTSNALIEESLIGPRTKGSTMTFTELDRLLDVPAGEFPERVEILARELDEQRITLKGLDPEITLPGMGDGEGSTSFTRQVLSLPRLDREGEGRLARRYALVKHRFYLALRRLGLAGEEESMEHIFCRETLTKGRCECRSCTEWENKVPGRSRPELKRRCREFNLVRNAFIEGSLYIVVLALSRFSNSRVSREDLLQEGSASLFRAVDRFDWRKGVRFRTYAEYWINQAFMEAIYNQSRTVRVPAWVQKATRKINQTRAKLGGQDTEEERARVAASLELPEQKVAEILEDNRQTISLDWEKAKGQSGSFSETLTGEGDTMDEAIDREKKRLLPLRLKKVLAAIPPRERMVLEHRFGLDGKEVKTLTDLGQEMGISAERVRQIQESALRRLQEPTHRKILAAI